MIWRLSDIRLPLEQEDRNLEKAVSLKLHIAPGLVRNLRVVRRAIDARKKPNLFQVFTVQFELDEALSAEIAGRKIPRLTRVEPVQLPRLTQISGNRHVAVIGMGPAGLFAAWHLARSGVRVTVLERGCPLEERVRHVRHFWASGELDPESNVQFGEGGAGTFSDGKLTTRLNHPWMRQILQTLVDFGAPPDICVEAKPHIGTDRLRLILLNFRRFLLEQGVDIRFRTLFQGLVQGEKGLQGALLGDGEFLSCDALVLAPGHSARDTYRLLHEQGVALEPKPFAVGVRVEHPAELINQIQYGTPRHPRLPAADYALAFNDAETGRGIYSFCMCPGGEVIAAASDPQGLVVNGMSYLSRAGDFSNSALVVTVRLADFSEPGPLGGVSFQQQLEQAAYRAGGGGFQAPAQNLLEFFGRGRGPMRSTYRPGVVEAELGQILPDFVAQGLRKALPYFDRRLRGFLTAEATVIGVETRTSAPLRIVRRTDGQSVSHPGLYPCGEGAGYAGGIMSAALDGLRIAEAIIANFQQQE